MNEKNKNNSASEILNAGMVTKDGNSETIDASDWRTYRPIAIPDKCKHCMLCVPMCPDDAIIHTADDKMEGFDLSKCKGCGACEKVCPFNAIEMVKEEIEGGRKNES